MSGRVRRALKVTSFFLARLNRAIRASRSRLNLRQNLIESRIIRRKKERTVEIDADSLRA